MTVKEAIRHIERYLAGAYVYDEEDLREALQVALKHLRTIQKSIEQGDGGTTSF